MGRAPFLAVSSASAGAAAVLGAAVLWGSIGVLSVGLFRLGLSPWEVAFWRAALSALILGVGVLLFRPRTVRLERRTDALLLGGFGVVGVGIFYAAFQLATYLTSVAVAVVLLYTAPVIVVIGARLLLGEALSTGKLVMVVAVVLGVWATAIGAVGAEVRLTVGGVVWGLLSALAYATYYLFGKRYVPRLGVLRTLLFSLSAGALVLAPAAALAGYPPRLALPAAAWPLLLALALGTTLLANALYYWGLARIEAGRAAILAAIEPVVAAVLALAIHRQALTPLGWLGVALVVAGVAAAPAGWRAPRKE
ncbi:MAG: DMT family transporter [Gemmatimonadetes bacterium]|nr:DMT family transporter [Gemmatimonadota bacterium]